jgi:lipid II:glycine glycyltransferase (peptidoglycan interpeptide bridge formation enzyme)
MVNYQLIKDANVWNESIVKEANFSPYQCYEWGQYKKEMGWQILSIKANKNGKIAYFQIAYKRKWNIFVGWCVGSIAGAIECFEKEKLISFIQKSFGVKYVLIKASFTNILDFNDSLALYSIGWEKSCTKLNSDYTIAIDLNLSTEALVQQCSSNFRKNLKRGYEKNKVIEVCLLDRIAISQVDTIFRAFETKKELTLPKANEIEVIKKCLGKHIVVAFSLIDNHMVALRACLLLGEHAIDFWAVSVGLGRDNYSSYPLLFELLNKTQALGCKQYDMSGIDPISNPSVYAFKSGLRGRVVEKLGEWEISNSKVLSFLINRVYL